MPRPSRGRAQTLAIVLTIAAAAVSRPGHGDGTPGAAVPTALATASPGTPPAATPSMAKQKPPRWHRGQSTTPAEHEWITQDLSGVHVTAKLLVSVEGKVAGADPILRAKGRTPAERFLVSREVADALVGTPRGRPTPRAASTRAGARSTSTSTSSPAASARRARR